MRVEKTRNIQYTDENYDMLQFTLGCGDAVIGGIGLNFGRGGMISVSLCLSRSFSITCLFNKAGSSDWDERIGFKRLSAF